MKQLPGGIGKIFLSVILWKSGFWFFLTFLCLCQYSCARHMARPKVIRGFKYCPYRGAPSIITKELHFAPIFCTITPSLIPAFYLGVQFELRLLRPYVLSFMLPPLSLDHLLLRCFALTVRGNKNVCCFIPLAKLTDNSPGLLCAVISGLTDH